MKIFHFRHNNGLQILVSADSFEKAEDKARHHTGYNTTWQEAKQLVVPEEGETVIAVFSPACAG